MDILKLTKTVIVYHDGSSKIPFWSGAKAGFQLLEVNQKIAGDVTVRDRQRHFIRG